ncbi:hypothetical protein [Arthrobacter sp. HY1533]|uniref:hypothetical protein n=1 Tax=Arthrobacter sp. HY1533 TaxID=2970919 RepID=UPI0022BA0CB4|nr:hypothetical protein [Arthrobacter sp. HY1533]
MMNTLFSPQVRHFQANDSNGGGSTAHQPLGGSYVTTRAPRTGPVGSYVTSDAARPARAGSYVTTEARPSGVPGSYVSAAQA